MLKLGVIKDYVMIDERLQHIFPPITEECSGKYSIKLVCNNAGTRGRIYCTVYGYLYEHTKNFCEAIGLDDEETMLWILKFGTKLPIFWTDGVAHGRN